MKYFFKGGYLTLLLSLMVLLLSMAFYKSPSLMMSQSIISKSISMFWIMDFEAVLFFSLLCLMVGSVYMFAEHYMKKDYQVLRFYWILTSFVLSMALLVFIPDFFFLLMGWDGLGITSFLLIAYYISSNSWSCSLKTFLMKRLGDGFFVVLLAFFVAQGHFLASSYDYMLLSGLSFLLVLGAFTKSAQVPFSSWLPAAMAAPTPVSALVHSSTLVTAGIYLLYRFFKLINPKVLGWLVWSGVWTLFAASLAACVEWDSKKIIAYSTLSQLGLMMLALGKSAPYQAFYHLLNHATFKAAFFICAGWGILAFSHNQDLRCTGGVLSTSPFLSLILLVNAGSLADIMFLKGWFSKDLMTLSSMKVSVLVFLVMSYGLTSLYTARLYLFFTTGKKNISLFSKYNSLLWLTLFSLLTGYVKSSFFYKKVKATNTLNTTISVFVVLGVSLSGWGTLKGWAWSLYLMMYLTPLNSSFLKGHLTPYFSGLDVLLEKKSLSGWGTLLSSASKLNPLMYLTPLNSSNYQSLMIILVVSSVFLF